MKTLIVTLLIALSNLVFAQNYAIKFNGTNQYASTNSNLGLGATSVTIEAWVNLPTTSEQGFFVHIGNGAISGSDGYGIGVGGVDANGAHTTDGTGNELLVLYDAVRWIPTGVNIGTGWHHIAFTIDANGNCIIYLDGVSVYSESGTGNTSPIAPSSSSYIATGNTTDRTLSNGTIDEVRVWNVVRTSAEIRANMFKEIAVNTTNLVAYYKMSNGSGTTLSDNCTNGTNYPFTLVNAPSWVTSSAFFGPKNGLEFPNNDASTSLCTANQNATSNTNNWTMMAWFNPASLTDIGFNAIVYNGTDNGGYGFGLRGNQLTALFGYAVNGWHENIATIPSTNRWYHVAMRRSGGTLQLFLDGKLLSYTSTAVPNTPEAKFTIGNMYDNTGAALYDDSFRGKIDEVSVWDTALTDAQIRDYMCKSLTGTETNLVAYYNFDNASGTTLPDFSGNTNDLTLTNMNASTDWVSSSAFNTWLNTDNSTWSTAANWSRGSVPGSSDNVGVQSYTGGTDLSVSGNPTVSNLVVSSSVTLTVSSGLTVTGNLVLDSDVDLNGQGISLSDSGTLIEGSGVFYGTSGYITTTRTLDGSTTQIDEDVAGLGAHITTSANMGSTTIRRYHSVQTIGSNSSIKRYYNISPTNNTGLNTTLVFNYRTAELNSLTEPNLRLFKSTDSGTSWTAAGGIINAVENKVTLTGINSFSRWTLAENTSGTIGTGCYSLHTIVTNASGTAYAWGNNADGELGNSGNTNSNVPVAVYTSGVLSGKTIVQVAAGSSHSIALASDGTVYTWGFNIGGQLGNSSNTNSNVPVAVYTSGVLAGKKIIQVAAGGAHSIALASDGTVYTWGDNAYGQLGNGNTTSSNVPVAIYTSGILASKTIIQVAAGLYYSIALASDGTVYTWGYNIHGQLGNGNNIDNYVPVAVYTSGVLTGKTIIQVAAGGYHSIALASDGTVYIWGYNIHGQLGDASNTDSNVPVAVSTSGVLAGKKIIQVAAGGYHSIALASNGTVYTWGDNIDGELGNGNNTNSNVPVAVSTSGALSGKTITQVAAGRFHSIALGSDGVVYTWGYNVEGELGNGSNTDSNVPVSVDQSGIGPLPVELTSFTAAIVEKGVLLNWKTATEVNNYGFEILRSAQNYNWENIGFVQGHGNSNSPKKYSFEDDNPPGGKVQYRLKQIDTDGQFEYSDVIEIVVGAPIKFELFQNYPNPFNPATIISYSIPEATFVKINVYNILGERVAQLVNGFKEAGEYNIHFDAGNLQSGIYVYQITAGDFKQVRKMMFIK